MADNPATKGSPQVTPATIMYTPTGKTEQIVDFHTVILEDHSTQAQVTKYPVQNGVHISNHSIRNNRVIAIRAMISNIRYQDKELNITSGRDYGLGATKVIKEVLDSLVNTGQECTVITNLGQYNPVVFTSFKTVQKAGMTDSMEVSLVGEEIIKVTGRAYSAPRTVTFEDIEGARLDALKRDLAEMGIEVEKCAKLSQAEVDKGESFKIPGLDAAGSAVETVFEFLGNDPVSGTLNYAQKMTGIGVERVDPDAKESPCVKEGLKESLLGGVEQIGGCLLGVADDFVEEAVEELVETAMGDLQDSIQGIFYDVVTMGSESGQALATAGLGCVIRGVTGTESEFPYLPGESLPTTEEIMSGNIFGPDQGSTELSKSGGAFDTETLTQIKCGCADPTTHEIDESLILPVG